MRTLRDGVGTGVGVALGPGEVVALGVDDGVALGDGDSCAFAKLNASNAIKTASSLFFVMSSETPVRLGPRHL